MSFTLFGLKFNFSVFFSIILSFMLIMDKTGYMSASLFAVILHELGHILIMKRVGCLPKSLTFSLCGILIVGNKFTTYRNNFLIAIAGPLTNFIITIIFIIIKNITGYNIFLYHSAIQFLIGFINILPIKGLDGEIILKYILVSLNIKKSDMIFEFISIFTACIFLAFGIVTLIINIRNPSLLLLGIYLIMLNILRL